MSPWPLVCVTVWMVATSFASFANVVPPPIGELDPDAPSLPENATSQQKLIFAAQSLAWARNKYPPEKYSPKADQLTPVEWQLLETLVVLDSVPNSPADEAAKAQETQRNNLAWNVIGKALKDPKELKSAKLEILRIVLAPTILGDGTAPARNALKAWTVSLLYDYRVSARVAEGHFDRQVDLVSELLALAKRQQDSTLKQGVPPSVPALLEKNIEAAERIRRASQAESQRINDLRAVEIKENSSKPFSRPFRPIDPRIYRLQHDPRTDVPAGRQNSRPIPQNGGPSTGGGFSKCPFLCMQTTIGSDSR